MIFKRIDHVEIVTDQLDRTVKFYTEVLGFTVKARDRIGARAAFQGSVVANWQSGDIIAESRIE